MRPPVPKNLQASSEDLERRLHMAAALAEEQLTARTAAERDADEFKSRLDHVVEASARSLNEPLGELRAASPGQRSLGYPLSPASASVSAGKRLSYGSPRKGAVASPLPRAQIASAVPPQPAPAAAPKKASAAKAVLGVPLFVLSLAVFANRYGERRGKALVLDLGGGTSQSALRLCDALFLNVPMPLVRPSASVAAPSTARCLCRSTRSSYSYSSYASSASVRVYSSVLSAPVSLIRWKISNCLRPLLLVHGFQWLPQSRSE